MHEIDLALLDEALEPCCIGEHGKGILARHGKGHDFATGLGDGGRYPPACGGNGGFRAGPGERLGDLDGRLLAARRYRGAARPAIWSLRPCPKVLEAV